MHTKKHALLVDREGVWLDRLYTYPKAKVVFIKLVLISCSHLATVLSAKTSSLLSLCQIFLSFRVCAYCNPENCQFLHTGTSQSTWGWIWGSKDTVT